MKMQGYIDKDYYEVVNEILLSFFKHKRYPTRCEKIRLAQLCKVDLQYVMNFFYNMRSVMRKIETPAETCCYGNRCEQFRFIQARNFKNFENTSLPYFYFGNDNSRYKRLPNKK